MSDRVRTIEVSPVVEHEKSCPSNHGVTNWANNFQRRCGSCNSTFVPRFINREAPRTILFDEFRLDIVPQAQPLYREVLLIDTTT